MSDYRMDDGDFQPRGTFGNGPLRRLREGRMFMGVAGGLADWLGTSRLVVRLAFVGLGLVFNFLTLFAYVGLGMLLGREARDARRRACGGSDSHRSGRRAERRAARRAEREAGRASRPGYQAPQQGAVEPGMAAPGSVVARFQEIERRLRQAEAEVTSPRYRFDHDLKAGGRT